MYIIVYIYLRLYIEYIKIIWYISCFFSDRSISLCEDKAEAMAAHIYGCRIIQRLLESESSGKPMDEDGDDDPWIHGSMAWYHLVINIYPLVN